LLLLAFFPSGCSQSAGDDGPLGWLALWRFYPGQKLAGQPPGPARWQHLASTAALALVLLRMRASSLGQAPVMRACE